MESCFYNKMINYYEALKSMYVDEIKVYDEFTHISSNIIDDGIWNFICGCKEDNMINVFEKNKKIFKNRTPRIYVLSSQCSEKNLQTLKSKYKIYCEDSWFCTPVQDLSLNFKSKLDIEIKVCKNKSDIINIIMKGFSTNDPNDPYGDLSPTYKDSLIQKLNVMDDNIINAVAYFNDKPISIATCTLKGNAAYLNNVTTLKEFKGKGIAKEILTFMLSELKKRNIIEIIFATETGMYTEHFYKKLGFKVVDYGICFEE